MYIPHRFQSGGTDISAQELLVGSNVGGIPLNGTTVRLAVDYKTQNAAV